jgi:cation-transporting ATPase E
VCVDKTGTLTEGHLRVAELRSTDPALDEQTVRSVLGALAASDPNPNATLAAIAGAAPPDGRPTLTAVAAVPFSSARKWSGVDLGPGGRWLLGAPDVLCPPGHPVLAQVEEEARSGARVVLLARTDGSLEEHGLDEVRPAASSSCATSSVPTRRRPSPTSLARTSPSR